MENRARRGYSRGNIVKVGVQILLVIMLAKRLEDPQLISWAGLRPVWYLVLVWSRSQLVRREMGLGPVEIQVQNLLLTHVGVTSKLQGPTEVRLGSASMLLVCTMSYSNWRFLLNFPRFALFRGLLLETAFSSLIPGVT